MRRTAAVCETTRMISYDAHMRTSFGWMGFVRAHLKVPVRHNPQWSSSHATECLLQVILSSLLFLRLYPYLLLTPSHPPYHHHHHSHPPALDHNPNQSAAGSVGGGGGAAAAAGGDGDGAYDCSVKKRAKSQIPFHCHPISLLSY